jgi:hypothetical protein
MNYLYLWLSCLVVISARAEVRVFVQEENRSAAIKYQCTGGEVIRAFALDVSVDRGEIIGITNFFKGESTSTTQGYGIFPASLRDNITITSGIPIDWDSPGYTPLAVMSDRPSDTLPGLDSSGVTLELGGFWNSTDPAAVPPFSGTLCTLQLSRAANVSIAPNVSRGGVVPASTDLSLTPLFTGAFVDPAFPVITGLSLTNGVVAINYVGGNLLKAAQLDGIWFDTGNTNGVYLELVEPGASRYFRVRQR